MEQLAQALTEWHPQLDNCWYGVPSGSSVNPAVYKAGANPQRVESGGGLGYLGYRPPVEGGRHVNVVLGSPCPGVGVGYVPHLVRSVFVWPHQVCWLGVAGANSVPVYEPPAPWMLRELHYEGIRGSPFAVARWHPEAWDGCVQVQALCLQATAPAGCPARFKGKPKCLFQAHRGTRVPSVDSQ